MPSVELETRIDAPRERVFDLARSVDLHTDSMADHDERAVDGTTSGLLGHGDRVTWRARHFGLPLTMTVEITEFDRPAHFRDEQLSGPFASLEHDHRFEVVEDGTLMIDEFSFTSPLGPVGRLVDTVVLRRYMRRLLRSRISYLETVAESDSRFLDS